MSELKLLNCPFCGSAAVGIFLADDEPTSSVLCKECGASGPPMYGLSPADLWQKRPLEDSLKAEAKRMRGALEFYANDKSWDEQYQSVPYGSTTAQMPMGSEADEDHGVRAKEALGLQCGDCGDDGEPPSANCPTCRGSGWKPLSAQAGEEK